MGDTRTLQQLRDDAAARADCTIAATGTNTTIAQANVWINQAITELRDTMIAEFGDDYFSSVTGNLTTTPSVDSYALPSDFYKLVGVDISFDNGATFRTVRRFEFADRNLARRSAGWSQAILPRYRTMGSNILFTPPPDTARVYRFWYIPTITRLVVDADTFDFVHGWDDWVACRTAIRVLQKEESDSSAQERDLSMIAQRIAGAVRNRDAGAPKRIQDTARRSLSAYRDGLDDEGW